MRSQVLLFLVMLSLLNCGQKPEETLTHLSGYWGIESVLMTNGDTKSYPYNNTIDYIKLNDSLKGFRKKMQPGINNTYITSEDVEALIAKIENDSLNLYYSTPFSNWKETVIFADEEFLEIRSMDNTTYKYKRYEPLNIDLTNE